MPPVAKKSQTASTKNTPKRRNKVEPVREIVFPEPDTEQWFGHDAMRAQDAKVLLGWTEEETEGEFGTDYLLTDMFGKKIRCSNNIKNRPLYKSNYESIMQEILQRRWELNGEAMIIGKTGLTINCQHRLVGLILAEQTRQIDAEGDRHWVKNWSDECTIETYVNVGIEESDRVINTMDTCKPRSFADVIYRSVLFAHYKAAERKSVARLCDHAVRMLWFRTGAGSNAWVPRRTHMEGVNFIERHPGILDAIAHIFAENKTDPSIAGQKQPRITRYFPPGYASAILYLMGVSATDPAKVDKYTQADNPTERMLDKSNWDKACEFWTLLGQSDKESPELRAVRTAILNLNDPDLVGGISGSLDMKLAILSLAWPLFLAGEDIVPSDVSLSKRTKPNESGYMVLMGTYDFGGIDRGSEEKPAKPEKAGKGPKVVEEEESPVPKKRGRPKKVEPIPSVNGEGGAVVEEHEEVEEVLDPEEAEEVEPIVEEIDEDVRVVDSSGARQRPGAGPTIVEEDVLDHLWREAGENDRRKKEAKKKLRVKPRSSCK